MAKRIAATNNNNKHIALSTNTYCPLPPTHCLRRTYVFVLYVAFSNNKYQNFRDVNDQGRCLSDGKANLNWKTQSQRAENCCKRGFFGQPRQQQQYEHHSYTQNNHSSVYGMLFSISLSPLDSSSHHTNTTSYIYIYLIYVCRHSINCLCDL